MKVLLVGGGTGGHILPLKNLSDELKALGAKVEIVVADQPLDRRVIEENFDSVSVHFLKSGKIRRYFSFQNFIDIFVILKSVFISRRLLKRVNPDVIFFKGGFVGFPLLISAKYLMRFKGNIYSHESDAVSGMMTRISKKHADATFSSFGVPSMPLFYSPSLRVDSPSLRCGGERKNILIFGASQGAQFLNELFAQNAEVLCDKYFVTLISGAGKEINFFHKNFEQFSFLSASGLFQKIQEADLIVSRAGSSSLFEIITAKKPGIIIPLPSAAQNHQQKNVEYFVKLNLCILLPQSPKAKNVFVELIDKTLNDLMLKEALRKSCIKNKAREIAERIMTRGKEQVARNKLLGQ